MFISPLLSFDISHFCLKTISLSWISWYKSVMCFVLFVERNYNIPIYYNVVNNKQFFLLCMIIHTYVSICQLHLYLALYSSLMLQRRKWTMNLCLNRLTKLFSILFVVCVCVCACTHCTKDFNFLHKPTCLFLYT